MATDVKLPRLGQGMESGVIVRWLKSEGEPVAKGEPLYELDTDKVTQEVESELDGVLTKIVVPEGDVEVGATVAVIESDGASGAPAEAAAEAPAEGPAEAPAEDSPTGGTEAQAPAAEPTAAAAPPAAEGRTAEAAPARLKASPLARRMARERGVDLASLQGFSPTTSSEQPRPPPHLRPRRPQLRRSLPARSRPSRSPRSARRSRGVSPRRGAPPSSSWACPPT
jgi:pyruvate dehydrogenase E2 component (dihydrolipoamide acetyltransferase)